MRYRFVILSALVLCLSSPLWAADSTPELWVSAHGSCLYPFGDLASFSYAAAGGGIGMEAQNLVIDHLCLGLDVEYLDFIPAMDGVTSIKSLGAVLTAGYRVPFTSELSVTPKSAGASGKRSRTATRRRRSGLRCRPDRYRGTF